MTDTPSRPAPQQEQAARFVCGDNGHAILDTHTGWGLQTRLTGAAASMSRVAYARAIAAALNASPPKEAT
jgi:hypothetical protein